MTVMLQEPIDAGSEERTGSFFAESIRPRPYRRGVLGVTISGQHHRHLDDEVDDLGKASGTTRANL